MPPSKISYGLPSNVPRPTLREDGIEYGFIEKLKGLKYEYRQDISDLMARLDLGWKARTEAKLALMEDLHPLLTKRARGRDISGLSASEN